MVVPSGCGGGGGGNGVSQAAPAPTQANVAVALTIASPLPPGNFRSMLLNISAVRINQHQTTNAGAPGWVTIPVPSAAGNGQGPSGGDLQIDVLQSQTSPTFFNIGGVPTGTYRSVQLVIDATNAGTIVPACQAAAGQEGCVSYPLQPSTNTPSSLIFGLGTPLPVAKGKTVPLVIAIGMQFDSVPPASNAYSVVASASEVNSGSFLASVSGTVSGTAGKIKGRHVFPFTVNAELTGTNNIIESAPLDINGNYTLELPAFPSSGTTYDVYFAGGGFTYGTKQALEVFPGQGITGMDFSVHPVTAFPVMGKVFDACTTGTGLSGVTLELLAPATPQPPTPTVKPTPTPVGTPISFCATNPSQCIVVASATTDQLGNYPMPGTSQRPTAFEQIPSGQPDYALRISASGYSTQTVSALLKGLHNIQCSGSSSNTSCNFSLTTGFINGQVQLTADPPPGNSVNVQVFAEVNGTNQIVGALQQPLNFVNGQRTLPFSLHVPITNPNGSPLTSLDLFDVAVDPFLGAPSAFSGHDIQVLANVPGPGSACAQASAPSFTPLNCVGHGSISGSVQNPDANTTIEVEKQSSGGPLVQLTGTAPEMFSSNSPNNPPNRYSICVPPDTYTVARFEQPSPSAAATPVAMQTVTVPRAAPTSSPCPSTCSDSDTSTAPCPGLCNNTEAQSF